MFRSSQSRETGQSTIKTKHDQPTLDTTQRMNQAKRLKEKASRVQSHWGTDLWNWLENPSEGHQELTAHINPNWKMFGCLDRANWCKPNPVGILALEILQISQPSGFYGRGGRQQPLKARLKHRRDAPWEKTLKLLTHQHLTTRSRPAEMNKNILIPSSFIHHIWTFFSQSGVGKSSNNIY